MFSYSQKISAKIAKKLTLSQTTNFRLPKWKSLQTTILNLMKMAESSSQGVENTVAKGQIARYEQFLLFPECFQKTCTAHKNQGFFGNRLKWNNTKTIDFQQHYGENKILTGKRSLTTRGGATTVVCEDLTLFETGFGGMLLGKADPLRGVSLLVRRSCKLCTRRATPRGSTGFFSMFMGCQSMNKGL